MDKIKVKDSSRRGVLKNESKHKDRELTLEEKAEYEAGVEAGRQDGIKVGVERGVVQGEKKKLIIQVCKKLQKGCSVEETAEMLEEDTETIQEIYEIAKAYAPEYDAEKICKEYMKHKMPE